MFYIKGEKKKVASLEHFLKSTEQSQGFSLQLTTITHIDKTELDLTENNQAIL